MPPPRGSVQIDKGASGSGVFGALRAPATISRPPVVFSGQLPISFRHVLPLDSTRDWPHHDLVDALRELESRRFHFVLKNSADSFKLFLREFAYLADSGFHLNPDRNPKGLARSLSILLLDSILRS
jgi:hypothetical protein